MSKTKGWFEKFLSSTTHRAERRQADRFAAYYWTGSALKEAYVSNISSTGVLLLAEEPWELGKVVSLTLQRKGPLELNPEHRMTWQARVVRRGGDGIGLSFISPTNPESRKWERLLESLAERTKVQDMLGLVRMAEALGFLRRLCPGGADEVKDLLEGGLSNHRVENAIEIAIEAESMLQGEPNADKLRVHPHLLVRVLEDGSASDGQWIQKCWAGLLAASCTPDGKDESNLASADLLNQLLSDHVRILEYACTTAPKVLSESGGVSSPMHACTTEEILEKSGTRPSRIHLEREQLTDLGLLVKEEELQVVVPARKVNLTPSIAGLQLYARCRGHRGPLKDFYSVSSADA
jgi:PilZ domain